MPAKFSRYTLHTYIDVRLRPSQTEVQAAPSTELHCIYYKLMGHFQEFGQASSIMDPFPVGVKSEH